MKKLITLTLIAFAVTKLTVPVQAATDTQKAALKAEKKARKDAEKAAKKLTQTNAKAAKAELKAASATAKVLAVVGSDAAALVPTPLELFAEYVDDDLAEAAEKARWLTLSPADRALAKAAWKAAEKAAEAAEKAAYKAMTSAERAAYKEAKKAAEALEDAAEAAREAVERAAYANMTIAERIAYNDSIEQDEFEFEYSLVGLTPEEIAIAIAAYELHEAAEDAEDYAEWLAMTPEERALELLDELELDDDVDDAEEIEIEDGEDFD